MSQNNNMLNINANTALQPIDADVRLAVLNPELSFALAAPAGSGKTGLLTQRVLTLLAYCDEPEEVLAITFTRKAAGEMQDRIMHALWQAAEQPAPSDAHSLRTWQLAQKVLERDRERQWNLLESPQRLRVQTIDSLCRAITKQLPLASGLGAQLDTLDNAEQAYRLAVRELIKLLEQDTPVRPALAQLLRHLDNNLPAVETLLISLLAKREQWLGVLLQARHSDARRYLEQVLQEVIDEHLTLTHQTLQLHASEVCSLADAAANNLKDEGERKNRIHELLGLSALPSCTPDALNQWLALGDLLLTNSGSYRARLTKAEGFPAGKDHAALKQRFSELIGNLRELAPEAEQLLEEIRHLPPATYADNQWQLLDSLTLILPVLAAQLLLVFKQQSATDYTAISQAALQALGDEDSPSDIALQLDYRIRHILVDEFQDTASPQLELLKKLTQGWQAGDGRTLFIVGDGMQSCYGFRNANVGLFLDARQQGVGDLSLIPLDLAVNFRSQAGVVDWVNHTFAQAFPAQDDISRGAVSYSPSVAFKAAPDDTAVQFFACTYDNEKNAQSEEDETPARQLAQMREAELVVELVQKARAQDPEGKIAILVRTRNHLARILPALSAAGLHYQATEIDSLASRMAIMDLVSLTRALLNPADRIAWLAVLRAPWCGLDNQDLHLIATANLGALSTRLSETSFALLWPQLRAYQELAGLSPQGQAVLTRVVPILQQALSDQYRKPLRQWVEGVWLALGGPACLLDANDGDNIQSFFVLLEQHQQGGSIIDWGLFDAVIKRLYAAPRADADPKLQVMTIHKSKGLEFDSVIIPGLDRSARRDDKQLLLWQERINTQGDKQLLLGSLAATGQDDDRLYQFMRREADKQQTFEATRLLYVGCTRAIKRLHLIACVNTKEGELKFTSKNALLQSIWPMVKEDAIRVTSGAQSQSSYQHSNREIEQAQPGLQHILRLSSQWQAPKPRDLTLLRSYRGSEFSMSEVENPLNLPATESTQARLARHTGSIIHLALQTIVENHEVTHNTCINAATAIAQQQPFWRIQLQQLGWRDHNLQQALQKIARAITQTLNSPKGRWLLNAEHEQSACELSLMRNEKQEVREAIIDRTFIDEGVRWIVDYKSSELSAGQTTEEFIAQELSNYQKQLQGYEKLMGALEHRPIKTALYFTGLGLLIECVATT